MKAVQFVMIAAVAILLAACDQEQTETRAAADITIDHPELILAGGTVITVDADVPDGQAVAIHHGRIQAVGSDADMRALAGPDTEIIELDGGVVIPGFIEGHGHFLGLGDARMILDLQAASSFEQIIDQVAAAVADAEPGQWVLGRGWHQERWQPAPEIAYDGVPAHHALSAVSPDNPVLLTHASGHASFANASAMALAGIDSDTPDPEGGTIVRDDQGQPTGFLRQAAQLAVRRSLRDSQGSMSEADRQAHFLRRVELAGEEALRHGITSFHDQGSSFAEIDRLRELDAQAQLPIRLHIAVRGESNSDMDERLAEYRQVATGSEFLTVRAVKRQIDGALGTHGAWLLEPYSDKPDTSGLPQTPLDSLRETAEVALRHGFQLNTHAIGDRGNREALDIYQDLLSQRADEDLRWRIEHAQNLHPDEVPRFAALGVIASMQGIHATSDGPWVPQRLGEERARQRAYVWRSLLDADAVICNGTDVPVEPISAIASYHASVTRLMSNGEYFWPEQAMNRIEALRSYTIGCARAVFDEERLGTISPGKLADLVVLDRNLLTVSDEELADTQVKMTLVGGEIRYRH